MQPALFLLDPVQPGLQEFHCLIMREAPLRRSPFSRGRRPEAGHQLLSFGFEVQDVFFMICTFLANDRPFYPRRSHPAPG